MYISGEVRWCVICSECKAQASHAAGAPIIAKSVLNSFLLQARGSAFYSSQLVTTAKVSDGMGDLASQVESLQVQAQLTELILTWVTEAYKIVQREMTGPNMPQLMLL